MHMQERNDQVYELRKSGLTYRQIASRFDISVERARAIYLKLKAIKEDSDSWPPLKKVLPGRLQKALVYAYNDPQILANPEKIKSVTLARLRKAPMMGKISMEELVDAMINLGYVKKGDQWLNSDIPGIVWPIKGR